MANDEEKSLVERDATQPKVSDENTLELGNRQTLDLTGLTEAEKRDLKRTHNEGMVEIAKKAGDMAVETTALGAKLSTMADETRNIADAGGSVTISNVSEGSIGKTEIMMGTSEAAKKGKLSKTISGDKDYTFYYIGLAVFALIVIAFVIMGN
nr:hypothetical protein 1 [Desulfobacterales bacterium]